jgi:hypothetical protein
MKQKFVIGIVIYAIFFAAVALSTGGPRARVLDLVILSLGACFWLVFSTYRITLWIKHTGRQPRRQPAALSNYPHWFSHWALDEDGGENKRRPMGLIDTI